MHRGSLYRRLRVDVFIHTAAVSLMHTINICTHLPNNYTINTLNSICSLCPPFHYSICAGRHLAGMSDTIILVFRHTVVIIMEHALGISALKT